MHLLALVRWLSTGIYPKVFLEKEKPWLLSTIFSMNSGIKALERYLKDFKSKRTSKKPERVTPKRKKKLRMKMLKMTRKMRKLSLLKMNGTKEFKKHSKELSLRWWLMKISQWNPRTFKRLCKSTLLKIIRKSISKNHLTRKSGSFLRQLVRAKAVWTSWSTTRIS